MAKRKRARRDNPRKDYSASGGAAKLADWMGRKRCSLKALAEIVDCTKQHVWNLVRGHNLPSLELAARIEEATVGEVPYTAWTLQ